MRYFKPKNSDEKLHCSLAGSRFFTGDNVMRHRMVASIAVDRSSRYWRLNDPFCCIYTASRLVSGTDEPTKLPLPVEDHDMVPWTSGVVANFCLGRASLPILHFFPFPSPLSNLFFTCFPHQIPLSVFSFFRTLAPRKAGVPGSSPEKLKF